jgi:WD40 repeat protein
VERYLHDEPVEACPPSAGYRLRKFARRHWAALAGAAAFAALLVVGVVVSVLLAVRATAAEGAAVAARDDEAEQRRKADQLAEIANRRADDLAWQDYINRVNLAYREVQEDNFALAEDLLHGCPAERRDWEWHYLKRLCHPERLSVEASAGRLIAVAYSPDGRLIATATDGAFSPSRGGPNVELWDRETGQRRLTLHGTGHRIWSLAFSPDGTKLAVGGTDPPIEVRDAQTGKVLWAKQEPRLPYAMSVAFHPDGQTLAAGFAEDSRFGGHLVKLYEVGTGRETVSLAGPEGAVRSLAFHPDGHHLAIARLKAVEVWNLTSRTKVRDLRGLNEEVYSMAGSPDGEWLATGGSDRTIRLWDAATGVERQTIRSHEVVEYAMAFSPDSRSLASAGSDKGVRLWEVPTGRQLGVFHGHTTFVQAVAFSPDGRELASVSKDGMLKLWDRRTSLPVVIEGVSAEMMGLWYRRDGRRIVISTKIQGQRTRQGWDPSTGELDPTLTGIDRSKLQAEYLPYPVQIAPGVPIPTATSPDGKLLARGLRVAATVLSQREQHSDDVTSTVEVWDLATSRVLYTLVGHTANVNCIAFSPDGRRIATAGDDRTVKLWDTATGREVFTIRGGTARLIALAFSPDGHRIVVGGFDETARVWDATPLPAETLQAQEERYRQKKTQLKALRDNAEAEKSEGAENNLSPISEWNRSADRLEKSIAIDYRVLPLRYWHLLTLLEARNRAGVRRACEDLLKQFGNNTDPGCAQTLAWYCVLAPDAVADPKAPVRLAQAALAGPAETGRARSNVLKTLGAALYRAGQFEEAMRRLDESIQTQGEGGDPRAFAFLALAHYRLGHHDEAERWLNKLVACRPEEGFDFSTDDMEIRILHREAESLILGSRPSAPPIAPSAPTKEASGHPGAKP